MSNDELKWNNDFGGPLFFSYEKINSGEVAIGYCRTKAFKVVNKHRLRQKWTNSNS